MQKKTFLLAFSLINYIAYLYRNWQHYTNDPIIEYRWLFDSLKITSNETINWLVDVVDGMSENDK